MVESSGHSLEQVLHVQRSALDLQSRELSEPNLYSTILDASSHRFREEIARGPTLFVCAKGDVYIPRVDPFAIGFIPRLSWGFDDPYTLYQLPVQSLFRTFPFPDSIRPPTGYILLYFEEEKQV